MKLRELLGREFIQELDENLIFLCKEIRKELRDENDTVIAITGYPGMGKSNDAAIIGMLIDSEYTFEDNICFIPTSKEIEKSYMNLPKYSVLHIDEASRGLHKHKWHDKIQQKLNELYDTEREGHFLCTLLLMPRFQNFTENFRNFRIRYWINVISKGVCVVYKRDEDKDCKDPWHLDENYKKKLKQWRGKKIFERSIADHITMEQRTENYLFYFRIPAIPKDVWSIYQELKKKSREFKEPDLELESYKDKLSREKTERFDKIKTLRVEGKTYEEIGVVLGCSAETIRRNIRRMEVLDKLKGELTPINHTIKSNTIIYNKLDLDKIHG